ncbi:hypothetical protein GCM10009738_85380 [Kitasatospora viridis]
MPAAEIPSGVHEVAPGSDACAGPVPNRPSTAAIAADRPSVRLTTTSLTPSPRHSVSQKIKPEDQPAQRGSGRPLGRPLPFVPSTVLRGATDHACQMPAFAASVAV